MSTMQRYFQDLRGCQLLDRDEELALFMTWRKTGDRDLRERLIRAHLRLVVKIANEYARRAIDLPDLIQEGNLGLLRALQSFDPERGVRLSSYASFWIRAFVLKFIIDNRRLVRIGTTRDQRDVFFGRTKDAGLPDEGRALLEQHIKGGETALDAPHATRSGRRVDHWADAHTAPPDLACEEAEERAMLKAALLEFEQDLDPRTRQIFRARWESEEQATLRELGQELGLSRERVRQIDERTLARLRTFLEDRQTLHDRQAAA